MSCNSAPAPAAEIMPRKHAAIVSALVMFLIAVAAVASAGRLDQVLHNGPYQQLDGVVLRQRSGRLTAGAWSHPAAADWDDDGDRDLIVGSGYGDLLYYQRKADGGLAAPVQMMPAEPALAYTRPKREQVSPAIADWNGDGLLDLLVGIRGRIYLYPRTADGLGRGRELHVDATALADAIKRSAGDCGHLAPCPADLDADGDLDLIVGDDRGRLWQLTNAGSAHAPRITGLVRLDHLDRHIDAMGNVRPAAGDWDGDGYVDLIIGTNRSLFVCFGENGGFAGPRPLYAPRSTAASIDAIAAADLAPAFCHWEPGAEGPQILLGERRGFIAVLARTPPGNVSWRGYVTADDMPLDVGRAAAVYPIDWDGDDDIDIVAGGEDGFVRLFQFVSQTGPTFSRPRIIADRGGPVRAAARNGVTPQMRYAWPCVADIDRDGDLDLLVGGANGRVGMWLNDGGFTAAGETSVAGDPVVMSGITSVHAIDYDTDGDNDLFVGTRVIPGSRIDTRIAPEAVVYLENKSDVRGQPPRFAKTVRIDAVLRRPEGRPGLRDADVLGNYFMQPVFWDADATLDFVVNTRLGTYLFGLSTERNAAPRLELDARQAAVPRPVLPPSWSCLATKLTGEKVGLLCGTHERGWVVWYPCASLAEVR